MDIGKCFRDAWGLYRLDLGPLVVTALIAAVVLAVVSVILSLAFAGGIGLMRFGGVAGGFLGSASAIVSFVLLFVVAVVVYAWAGSTMFAMILRRVRERRPADYTDLREFDRTGPFAIAAVVLGIIIGVGYALLVIPGLILTTFWVFALTMVVDRGIGVGEAMSESKDLAQGFGYMNTFATWVVGALVVGVIVGVLNLIPFFGFIVGLLAVPFGAAYLVSMYFQATGEGHLVDAAVADVR